MIEYGVLVSNGFSDFMRTAIGSIKSLDLIHWLGMVAAFLVLYFILKR